MTAFGATTHGPPTVFLSGELDMAAVPTFEDAIGDVAPEGGPITLDLSQMTFIDSSGVAGILAAAGARASGCITLHGARDAARRIFDVMGIARTPNVHVSPCSVPVRVG